LDKTDKYVYGRIIFSKSGRYCYWF